MEENAASQRGKRNLEFRKNQYGHGTKRGKAWDGASARGADAFRLRCWSGNRKLWKRDHGARRPPIADRLQHTETACEVPYEKRVCTAAEVHSAGGAHFQAGVKKLYDRPMDDFHSNALTKKQ